MGNNDDSFWWDFCRRGQGPHLHGAWATGASGQTLINATASAELEPHGPTRTKPGSGVDRAPASLSGPEFSSREGTGKVDTKTTITWAVATREKNRRPLLKTGLAACRSEAAAEVTSLAEDGSPDVLYVATEQIQGHKDAGLGPTVTRESTTDECVACKTCIACNLGIHSCCYAVPCAGTGRTHACECTHQGLNDPR